MNETLQRQTVTGPNWVNILLGLWVLISPFVLAFSNLREIMWNNVATGGAVLLLAFSLAGDNLPVLVLNVLLGGWLMVSPFVLGFSMSVPFWNNIILGALIAIAALVVATAKPRPARNANPPALREM